MQAGGSFTGIQDPGPSSHLCNPGVTWEARHSPLPQSWPYPPIFRNPFSWPTNPSAGRERKHFFPFLSFSKYPGRSHGFLGWSSHLVPNQLLALSLCRSSPQDLPPREGERLEDVENTRAGSIWGSALQGDNINLVLPARTGQDGGGGGGHRVALLSKSNFLSLRVTHGRKVSTARCRSEITIT